MTFRYRLSAVHCVFFGLTLVCPPFVQFPHIFGGCTAYHAEINQLLGISLVQNYYFMSNSAIFPLFKASAKEIGKELVCCKKASGKKCLRRHWFFAKFSIMCIELGIFLML